MELVSALTFESIGCGILLTAIEFVLVLGLDFANTPGVNKWIRCLFKVVIWGCMIVYTVLFLLCIVCAVFNFRQGDYRATVVLAGTACGILIANYVLFIRYYIKTFCKKRR